MSAATLTEQPFQAGTEHGGVPAWRAVIHWSLRLFRREWRQQLLMLGLLGLNQISDGATVLGLVIALGVLVMSVGLVRSETAGELRTLSAVGASSRIRRTITGATAGAIGLLGAVLGAAGATVAGVAWARSSLGTTFGDFPVVDLISILVGLPAVAAVGAWLLAGRRPPAIARQALD